MRVGVTVGGRIRAVVDEARQAEAAGLELCWIRSIEADGTPRPSAVLAAAVAAQTDYIRIVLELPAERHPIEIAEELVVCDQLSNGRIIGALIVQDPEVAEECVEVVVSALTARPFAHRGPRWTLPADGPEDQIRVTPSTCQTELPLWIIGNGAQPIAQRFGLAAVQTDLDTDLNSSPNASHSRTRPALFGAVHGPEASIDVAETVSMLRRAQRVWGVDTATINLTSLDGGPSRAETVNAIAGRIRPQLQLESLPDELVASWDDQQERS